MLKRLFRPFLTLDGDETTGGAEPVEAPVADQPNTPDATLEATAPETSDAETTTADAPEASEAPDADEFTDLSAVPEELQGRAKEMQADYTRKTQALAERHAELDNAVDFVAELVADEPNPTMEAVFKTLAAKLGYDLEGDDAPEEATDDAVDPAEPVDERQAKIDALLAREDEKAATAATAAYEAHLDTVESEISDGITALAKADGIDLSDDELDVIFNDVLALPPEGEKPAIKAAYTRYTKAAKAHLDRVIASKQSTLAPGGPAAGEKPDRSTPEARIATAARAIEASRA